MKGLEFSDYKYMIALQFVEIGLYVILTLVHNRKWERKSLQRKETPDEKKVKKKQRVRKHHKGKKCMTTVTTSSDTGWLWRLPVETTKLGGDYRRCSAQSS